MFLPLVSRSVDPVCFNISLLYQIISSYHINFTSLAIISPILNENYLRITYVTLKAPGSEKISPKLHIERIDLQLLSNKLQILYYQEMRKK